MKVKLSNYLLMAVLQAMLAVCRGIQMEKQQLQKENNFCIYEGKLDEGYTIILLPSESLTNFIYEIEGINREKAIEINATGTCTLTENRMMQIKEYGGIIRYIGMENIIFKHNLVMLDSYMPEILGNMLLYSYSENINDCKQLVELMAKKDPIGYNEKNIYEYKFKRFLCACALGMTPMKMWDGMEKINGGFKIVKSDGEEIVYSIYKREFFEQYLFDNAVYGCKITNNYENMKLYDEKGKLYIKLNLQISIGQ